ncbi:reverse transcriptase domain-containing protein [Tanacetum coccineum]
MVKKNDGGWRMCVDFTDINKACPKDCYPLPEIDWKIESLAGFRLKCFLDAYKGYHQIQMAEGDEDKTAFFVGEGVFCYRKMPFGLKNAGATYQRLVDKVFSKQIRRNLEAYVDDMVIKSTSEEGMLSDIQETFERFRSINMKLNPKKCSFGVEEGPFLGHLITKQGIKANPTKIKAVTELEQPRALKDIQSLNGKLAALSRFLSKGAERSLPFFKVLKSCKGKKKIHWTDEADKALPTLTAPRARETLTMYLATSKESIDAALFAKRSEGQIPIYFVSRVLQGAELNYPALEKLILALVHASRRLRRYFQAHTIMVLTGTPIKQALIGPEKTGRVAKWAIELGEHDIVFLKRDERETPADFLPEIPFDDSEKKVKEKEVSDPSNEWKLYTDGASSSDGAGARLMLIDPAGKEYTYAIRFEFETTNNEAEYEALLAGLRIAQEMEITKVAIFLDSQLVVNQIKGTYAAKQLSIKSYLQKVKTALKGFKGEAAKAIQDCDKCKEQSAIRKVGVDGAITVGSTWPFSHWGIHILGPLPMAPGGLQFLAITVEHSTKWVEAKPITVKNARQVEKFVWEYVVCRFRVPRMISSKEEKRFKEGIFADFCKGLKITQTFSPITEHMEIMHYIEKQLVRSQQSWVDNLAKELWVHRTLPRNSQEETPFSLTYGSEAVVPIVEATDDRGRTQETTKKGKEIASIEKAHYRNKL